MSGEMWAAIGVAVAALFGLFGALYTQRSARRSTEHATTASLSDDLLGRFDKRVGDLESTVARLEEKVKTLDAVARAFSLFVDRIGFWVERGAKPEERPKPPAVIHQHIDMKPWS